MDEDVELDEVAEQEKPAVSKYGQVIRNCIDGIATTFLGIYDLYNSGGGSRLGYGLSYYGLVRVAGCLIKFFPEPPMPRPIPQMPWPSPPENWWPPSGTPIN